VDIEFDPAVVNYEEMLQLFFKFHDATAPSPGCSRQYMSAIFCHGEEQLQLAKKSAQKAEQELRKKVQTEISPAKPFYNAEDYHQKYILQKHTELMEMLQLKRGPKLIESSVAARINGYIGGYGTKAAFEAETGHLNLDSEVVDYVLDNFKYTKFTR